MNKLISCRRTFVCVLSIILCFVLALVLKIDTTTAIMGIAIGLAGFNGTEAAAKSFAEAKNRG